jgi:hypothetical protein
MGNYKETVRLVSTGRGAQLGLCCFKHHELKSFGRFWYREILDFQIPGWAVSAEA